LNLKIRKKLNLLKTPFGRKDISHTLLNQLYPVTRPLAAVYRRTVLRQVKIISVIGSLGKSTTCRAIAAVVGDKKLKGYSNYKNSIIRNMLKHGPSSPYAVLETAVGGPGLMGGYGSMLQPDIVVVTSIASEHILTFGSLENIREEKAAMLRGLAKDKTAVINADDPNVVWMASQTSAGIITYGTSEKADIRAENIRVSPPEGMEFDVRIDGRTFHLRIPLLGRHMIYPSLSALAVAMHESMDISEACGILQNLRSMDARMNTVTLPSGAVLIRDDYKATRESVWRALETMEEYPAKRKILVLGGVSEIFNEERYEFYRDLGSRIARAADHAFLYLQKNSFRRCRIGAVEAGMDPDQITRIRFDPLSVASLLPEDLGIGDLVLVKGRTDYKISRLSLVLMGKKVNCRLMSCSVTTSHCDECYMLERGWENEE
jgi:UDP-N-acetylmuramoyl-tripeptide--D-alanyl-D-alanine ligase